MNYPETPMRNCLYCRHYGAKANACNAPGAEKIAVFNPNEDADCILLKYDKIENPKINEPSFVAQYCIGKKCPYYFAKHNLCTRPSLCPYKAESENMFKNIKFNKTDLS